MRKIRTPVVFLVIILLLGCISPFVYGKTVGQINEAEPAAVSSASHTIFSQTYYSVLDGMRETTLVMKNSSGNRVEGHMMEIAPGAAVTAKVSYPGYYKKGSTPASRKSFADNPVWSKKTTTGQAADFTTATGQPVLFAINTDNFITESTVTTGLTVGQCCGHLIMEGNICQTTEHRARPFFAVLKDGSFAIRDANADLSDVVEATSGRIYIVKDGKNVVDPAHSEELGLMPYNSIGLKRDGTVVVFQVDGRRSDSVGFTEMEMAEYLLAQGVYTALILDGGGSATFASRREGDSKLTLRNQPSDGTERALGSTLLFVSNRDSLFFDYSGDTAAQERYSSFTYRGNNFDVSSAWKPTAGASDTVSVDTATGTMTITKSATNTLGYCYVQTQASSGKALGFRPDHGEYLQIRMRLKGFDPAASNTNFSIHYYADGSSTQTTNAVRYVFGSGYVFDGKDILLTLPVEEKFRNAEFIDAIKMNFSNLSGEGTIEIDYLYIGPKVSLPEQDFLYFDFQGTPLDADRYESKTYGFQNFDTEGWGYNGKKSSTPVLGNDSLSFDVLATTDNYVNTGHSPYIHTADSTGSMTAKALSYRPGEKDYFQIRFRMKDCTGVSGLTPMVRFYFAADGSSSFVGNVKKDLTTTEMTSDTYYVVTLPLYTNTAYQGAESLDYFRLNFQNVCAVGGKTGKITIDYIYVGPQESLPQQDKLFMDFTDDDAAQLRYRSKTYGFQNYDQGSWAYNAKKCEKPTFSDGSMVITMTPTTDNYVNTGHSPYFQTSDVNAALSRSVLRYKTGTGDVVQVRFKMENCMAVPGKTAMLRFFYTNDDSASTAGYVHRNLTATEIGSSDFLTVTLPLYVQDAYVNSEYIRRIQITMQNLCSAEGKTGKIYVDYIYVGPESQVPTPQYTVTFVGADGKTLETKTVHKGETATYTGATPTKTYDATYHYSFKGWDKALTDISADMVVTAQYSATAHGFTYTPTEDHHKHRRTCACGYSDETDGHRYFFYSYSSEQHTRHCGDCGFEDLAWHIFTYTSNGDSQHTRYCNWCKYEDAVEHTWDTGTVTTVANCTTAGMKTYTCTGCSATKTESITATGHEYTSVTTEPTCTEGGYTTHTCYLCSHTYRDTYIDAVGHTSVYTSKDGDFHIVTCENCDYREEAPHSYTDGLCICGQAEIKEPMENTAWKIGHTLNLAGDISVNLVVSKSLLEGFDMETVYVLAEVEVYEGNEAVGTETVKLTPVEKGDYYYFTITGLTAVQMNNRIRSVLYGTKDGQPYYSATDDYCIADYAYSQINKEKMPHSLKILCADLLRYGGKAQIFKGYRTDALADRKMTEEQKAFLSDIDTVVFGNTNTVLNDLDGATVTWAGKALDLASKVALKFIFNPASYEGDLKDLTLRLSFDGIDGEIKTVILEGAELYNADRGLYAFTFDGLLAAELRTVVSAQIYAGDSPVSCTLQYSADTYGNNKPGTLLDLCKALFAYSDSAKTYFMGENFERRKGDIST